MFGIASTIFSKAFSLLSGSVGKYLIYLILAAVVVGGITYMYWSISAKDAKIAQLGQNVAILTKQNQQTISANKQLKSELAQLQKDNAFLQTQITSITIQDQQQAAKTAAIIKSLLSKKTMNVLNQERKSASPVQQKKFIATVNSQINCMFSSISTGVSCKQF